MNMPSIPHDDNAIDQSRLQQLLGWQVSRAELHLTRKFIEHLAPFSLRPVDFFILVLIDGNHGINQRQIGDALGISPPNLVSVMTRMIKNRLIRRARGRHDRRVQHLYLTATGSECLARAEIAIARFEQELATLLPARGRTALQQTLQQIIASP